MKSKLEQYILDEERNINSDLSTIKKMVKGYIDKRKKIKGVLFDEIGKKTISMTKTFTENEIEDFKYQIINWMSKMGGETDLTGNIEALIDVIIEKKY